MKHLLPKHSVAIDWFKYGRSGEIRTPDPLFPKQMRYQAALHSDWAMFTLSSALFSSLKLHKK